MGTRSLTSIREDGKVLVNIYRQFDGYPSGHGAELSRFLNSRTMVNGISGNGRSVFNGPGCMAAQLIRHLKGDEAGNIYVDFPDSFAGYDCDYVYTVDVPSLKNIGWKTEYGDMKITVKGYGEEIFEGDRDGFHLFVTKGLED